MKFFLHIFIVAVLALIVKSYFFEDTAQNEVLSSELDTQTFALPDSQSDDFSSTSSENTGLDTLPLPKNIESDESLPRDDEGIIVSDDDAPAPANEDINFNFALDQSTYHLINGGASGDLGELSFQSELLPSNEVTLNIKLNQVDADGVELSAYFDLANYTMELDGKDGVLNQEHKQLLKLTATQLQNKILAQYEGYGIPEHALMLTQMLSYWAMSPEGFVHEKRTIVSQ